MKLTFKTKPILPEFCVADEWVRLPKPREKFMGMSRTTLFELCLQGKIRSIVIKKRYAVRGIRLIHLPSLRQFLLSNSSGGSNKGENGKPL